MADSRTPLLVLLGLLIAGVTVVALIHPHPAWPAQDPAYYQFADGRTMFGVPNFWNVASNAPFLPVGLLGLARLSSSRERPLFAVVFLGVALTAFGSAYFHWAPSTPTLFWDRLPMTLVFTALFTLVLIETVGPRSRAALWPLVAVGVASVVYWRWSEGVGHGDLRPYALVQFVPMAAIPILILLRRPPATRTYLVIIGWYALAKVLEVADAQVLRATAGAISGHSLKHVVAAIATVPMLTLARRAS